MLTSISLHHEYFISVAFRSAKAASCASVAMHKGAIVLRGLLIASLSTVVTCCTYASDQIPGAPQQQPIAITGAVIHTMTGKEIENGVVVFEAGKFTVVGKRGAIPEGAEILEATGKHLYPSLIDANTDIGLVEINSIRATIDSR